MEGKTLQAGATSRFYNPLIDPLRKVSGFQCVGVFDHGGVRPPVFVNPHKRFSVVEVDRIDLCEALRVVPWVAWVSVMPRLSPLKFSPRFIVLYGG